MSQRLVLPAFLLAICMAAGPVSAESEADALLQLLQDFLAGASVGDVEVHDKFWADDLVYTSSSGTRTNKARIMEELAAAEPDDADPKLVYTAEEVDIRLYGATAIVAFRLVGTPQGEDSNPAQYFNTGTFLKRDGEWRAVAWQATRIPDSEAEQ